MQPKAMGHTEPQAVQNLERGLAVFVDLGEDASVGDHHNIGGVLEELEVLICVGWKADEAVVTPVHSSCRLSSEHRAILCDVCMARKKGHIHENSSGRYANQSLLEKRLQAAALIIDKTGGQQRANMCAVQGLTLWKGGSGPWWRRSLEHASRLPQPQIPGSRMDGSMRNERLETRAATKVVTIPIRLSPKACLEVLQRHPLSLNLP